MPCAAVHAAEVAAPHRSTGSRGVRRSTRAAQTPAPYPPRCPILTSPPGEPCTLYHGPGPRLPQRPLTAGWSRSRRGVLDIGHDGAVRSAGSRSVGRALRREARLETAWRTLVVLLEHVVDGRSFHQAVFCIEHDDVPRHDAPQTTVTPGNDVEPIDRTRSSENL
jgi:hypothetical protein